MCIMSVPHGRGKKKEEEKKTYRVVVGLEVVANLPSGVPVATKTGLPKKRGKEKLVYFQAKAIGIGQNARRRCKDPDP